MAIDYRAMGMRIRQKRTEKGWSQAELAERSGIEPSNISHIERAATKLSLPTLVSIANALGATLDELAYDSLTKNAAVSYEKINGLLADCTDAELQAMVEMIGTTKAVLRRYT